MNTLRPSSVLLAGAAFLGFAAALHFREKSNRLSAADIDVAVAESLVELSCLDANGARMTSVVVCKATHPPLPLSPWFWHAAATCSGCRDEFDDDSEDGPTPLNVVHEQSGWSRSSSGASAEAARVLSQMT